MVHNQKKLQTYMNIRALQDNNTKAGEQMGLDITSQLIKKCLLLHHMHQ